MFRFYNKDIQIFVTLLLELEMFEIVLLYNFEDHGSNHLELFYKKGFLKTHRKVSLLESRF